ncbi:MAG: type II and III secretion system protein family protein [Rubricella sp.]
MTLRKLIRAVGVLCAMTVAPMQLHAQDGAAPLRVIQGPTTDMIEVAVDRAVIVETARPVGELSIANPRIADVAVLGDRTLYVLGRATGRTTLTLVDDQGQILTNVDIAVTPDISEFKERLDEILPGQNIEVRTANDGIVLSGTVSGATAVQSALDLAERYAPEAVTNLLTVGGSQQVLLEVRFAEMQRSVARELGSSIATSFVDGNFGGVAGTRTLSTGDNLINLYDGDPATNVELSPGQAGAFLLGFQSGNLAIDLLLEALETQGMVRTLAEPNIVALSGERARFLAGGEYPVPVVDEDGAVQVEFRPFGVELIFTPTVVNEDLINLRLNTSVSAIDTTISVIANGFEINAFSSRRTETVIELRDGASFAIAGLIQDDFNDSIGGIPWISDVPILGALFRSASFQRDQTELVVIVTPHLVSETDGNRLSLPTDRVRIPNERELFLFGQVTGQPDVAQIAEQDFEGGYGYVLE